ncbi:MAG: hypothetical protein ABI999_00030 [Acidobacteriota bacterium]
MPFNAEKAHGWRERWGTGHGLTSTGSAPESSSVRRLSGATRVQKGGVAVLRRDVLFQAPGKPRRIQKSAS